MDTTNTNNGNINGVIKVGIYQTPTGVSGGSGPINRIAYGTISYTDYGKKLITTTPVSVTLQPGVYHVIWTCTGGIYTYVFPALRGRLFNDSPYSTSFPTAYTTSYSSALTPPSTLALANLTPSSSGNVLLIHKLLNV
jgi:hypothetical protein